MEQLIGIILHWIGGFSSASFYVPYSKIKKWSWITYWISLGWTYIFGFLWGFGGLMAGLALRYLGLSLGQSITLGVSAVVGTLIPAIIDNKVLALVTTISGAVISFGLLMTLIGIAFTGY